MSLQSESARTIITAVQVHEAVFQRHLGALAHLKIRNEIEKKKMRKENVPLTKVVLLIIFHTTCIKIWYLLISVYIISTHTHLFVVEQQPLPVFLQVADVVAVVSVLAQMGNNPDQ